jgi:Trypsin-like peptidase domain
MKTTFQNYQKTLLSIQDLVWQNTVGILYSNSRMAKTIGSGFCVGPNLVVTAAHCLKDEKGQYGHAWAEQFELFHPFGNQSCKIALLGLAPNLDVALVKVQGNPFANIQHLKFAADLDIQPNRRVIVPCLGPCRTITWKQEEIARLVDLTPSFREGRSHKKYKFNHGFAARLYKLSLQKGFSGGPIVDKKTGEVVSVVFKAQFMNDLNDDSVATFGRTTRDIQNFVAGATASLLGTPSSVS